ncbi:hypothetical protein AGDE_16861 [Angomonas deanei]|nr:hypothetical protein AGDE_16861 [Angomonas deanei]|eukprot:EPY16040.1 hypothetical protein AGDE_16861 [Angomonas deanei]
MGAGASKKEGSTPPATPQKMNVSRDYASYPPGGHNRSVPLEKTLPTTSPSKGSENKKDFPLIKRASMKLNQIKSKPTTTTADDTSLPQFPPVEPEKKEVFLPKPPSRRPSDVEENSILRRRSLPPGEANDGGSPKGNFYDKYQPNAFERKRLELRASFGENSVSRRRRVSITVEDGEGMQNKLAREEAEAKPPQVNNNNNSASSFKNPIVSSRNSSNMGVTPVHSNRQVSASSVTRHSTGSSASSGSSGVYYVDDDFFSLPEDYTDDHQKSEEPVVKKKATKKTKNELRASTDTTDSVEARLNHHLKFLKPVVEDTPVLQEKPTVQPEPVVSTRSPRATAVKKSQPNQEVTSTVENTTRRLSAPHGVTPQPEKNPRRYTTTTTTLPPVSMNRSTNVNKSNSALHTQSAAAVKPVSASNSFMLNNYDEWKQYSNSRRASFAKD